VDLFAFSLAFVFRHLNLRVLKSLRLEASVTTKQTPGCCFCFSSVFSPQIRANPPSQNISERVLEIGVLLPPFSIPVEKKTLFAALLFVFPVLVLIYACWDTFSVCVCMCVRVCVCVCVNVCGDRL